MAMKIVAPLLILLLASPTVFGTDYTVGDTNGWALGNDYTTWAKGKTFKVGDTLLFNYDGTHQVDEVDKAGYDGCSSSNTIKNYNDGKTKITLSKAGNMYFICPTAGHCAGGMKLSINVVAASGGSPPTTPSGSPPTAPTTPETPATPSTPETPATPSTPTTSAPAPKNSGFSVTIGITQLLGSLVVSGIFLGFMI